MGYKLAGNHIGVHINEKKTIKWVSLSRKGRHTGEDKRKTESFSLSVDERGDMRSGTDQEESLLN